MAMLAHRRGYVHGVFVMYIVLAAKMIEEWKGERCEICIIGLKGWLLSIFRCKIISRRGPVDPCEHSYESNCAEKQGKKRK